MKKICLSFAVVMLLTLGFVPAHSGHAYTYTFTPSDADLGDLEHAKVYTWGIKWALPTGQQITSAKITYNDIWDWKVETDHLFTHLLDTVNGTNGWTTVTMSGYTYQRKTTITSDSDGSVDSFSGQGLLLGDWDDPVGGYNRYYDLSYDIPSANFGWLSDGNFGFGIDPNCHYYNDGVVFTVVTAPVPEPATMLLLASGLAGLAGFRRRIEKK